MCLILRRPDCPMNGRYCHAYYNDSSTHSSASPPTSRTLSGPLLKDCLCPAFLTQPSSLLNLRDGQAPVYLSCRSEAQSSTLWPSVTSAGSRLSRWTHQSWEEERQLATPGLGKREQEKQASIWQPGRQAGGASRPGEGSQRAEPSWEKAPSHIPPSWRSLQPCIVQL